MLTYTTEQVEKIVEEFKNNKDDMVLKVSIPTSRGGWDVTNKEDLLSQISDLLTEYVQLRKNVDDVVKSIDEDIKNTEKQCNEECGSMASECACCAYSHYESYLITLGEIKQNLTKKEKENG